MRAPLMIGILGSSGSRPTAPISASWNCVHLDSILSGLHHAKDALMEEVNAAFDTKPPETLGRIRRVLSRLFCRKFCWRKAATPSSFRAGIFVVGQVVILAVGTDVTPIRPDKVEGAVKLVSSFYRGKDRTQRTLQPLGLSAVLEIEPQITLRSTRA